MEKMEKILFMSVVPVFGFPVPDGVSLRSIYRSRSR